MDLLLRVSRNIDTTRATVIWMPRVYIGLCNVLTDKRLKQAVAETDGKRPGDVYAACGCCDLAWKKDPV
jgi:hypothetical protein